MTLMPSKSASNPALSPIPTSHSTSPGRTSNSNSTSAKVLLSRRHIPPPRSRVRIAGKRVHGQSPLASSSTTSPHSEDGDSDADGDRGRGLVSAVEKLTMELGLETGIRNGHEEPVVGAEPGDGGHGLAPQRSHALASLPTSTPSHPYHEDDSDEYDTESDTDEDERSFGHPLTRMVDLRVPDLSTRGLPQSGFASGVGSPVPRYPGAWGSNQHQGHAQGNGTQYEGGLDLAALGSALSSTHSLGMFRGSSPEDGMDEGCWSDEDECTTSSEEEGSESDSMQFTWDSWRRDFDQILDELDPGVMRDSGMRYIDIPPSSAFAKDALLLRHFVLPTHHARPFQRQNAASTDSTHIAPPSPITEQTHTPEDQSAISHIKQAPAHIDESTQPSTSLDPSSPVDAQQQHSSAESGPSTSPKASDAKHSPEIDATHEPHYESDANHELVLLLQLNHHEPREDPWNPVPHVVKAIERERVDTARGREKRVNVVEKGEVYSVCAGDGGEHGDGDGDGEEGVDVYIFMEGLRAWNDPPLKTVHNYIDLFRQILEGMAFLHEKHITLGPGTFASPARLGLMVDIGYSAQSVVPSPYPSGRQSHGELKSGASSMAGSVYAERGSTSAERTARSRGSRSPGRHGIGHTMDRRPLTRINASPPSISRPGARMTASPPASNPPPAGLTTSKAASASAASFDRTLYPVKYYFTNLARAVQLDSGPPPPESESEDEHHDGSGNVKGKGGMKGDVVDCAGLFEALLGEVPKIAPKLRTLVKAMKSGGFGAEDARKLFEAMVSSLEAGVFESSAGGGAE